MVSVEVRSAPASRSRGSRASGGGRARRAAVARGDQRELRVGELVRADGAEAESAQAAAELRDAHAAGRSRSKSCIASFTCSTVALA